ncbi:MAG: zinc-dependent metalloprotease [Bacteroidia bacterium]
MKKVVFTIAAFALIGLSHVKAQTFIPVQEPADANGTVRCAQVMYDNYLRSKDKNYDKKRAVIDKIIREGSDKSVQARLSGNAQILTTQYTIPVVFHIVYNTTAENITDAQVMDGLSQLNMDWSRTNSDTGNTPAAFKSLAANMHVQFCLAQKDPSGAPTTGIIHKSTTVTGGFTSDDKIKQSVNGGDDPWDVNKYLNIWIGNLNGGLLGYGNFPPINAASGTVVHYITVGSLLNPNPAGGAYGQGRTLSHEIGHCFGLYHIWGDDAGACTGSDQIADTPNMADATSGCPSGVVLDACAVGQDSPPSNFGSNVAPGRMYQDFMDYTDDLCYNMFTVGQEAAVQNIIATQLITIANNATVSCAPPVALDAGIASISSPTGNYCVNTFTPTVTVKNFGTTTLTSCTINYNIDGGANIPYSWTGSLTTGQTAAVTVAPSMTATAGTHTFIAATSAPNGGTDANTANDQSQSLFNIGSTGSAIPVTEGFEGTTFPPAGWVESNSPSNSLAWQQSTTYGSQSSVKSAFFNNCNPADTTHGLREQLRTITYNFSSATSTAGISFDVGYAPYYATSYCDTLKVYYSINCGSTWTKVYQKGGTVLASVPCVATNTTAPCNTYTTTGGCFAPTTSAAWRNDLINLGVLAGQPSVMFAFENVTDYGNNLYIDNINIMASNTIGIKEINLNDNVSVYPNPSDGTVFVNVTVNNIGKVNIRIYNLLGETVSEQSDNSSTAKSFNFDLTNLSNAVYFVEIKTDMGGSAIKKLVLNK